MYRSVILITIFFWWSYRFVLVNNVLPIAETSNLNLKSWRSPFTGRTNISITSWKTSFMFKIHLSDIFNKKILYLQVYYSLFQKWGHTGNLALSVWKIIFSTGSDVFPGKWNFPFKHLSFHTKFNSYRKYLTSDLKKFIFTRTGNY